jgi:hypothetical protein
MAGGMIDPRHALRLFVVPIFFSGCWVPNADWKEHATVDGVLEVPPGESAKQRATCEWNFGNGSLDVVGSLALGVPDHPPTTLRVFDQEALLGEASAGPDLYALPTVTFSLHCKASTCTITRVIEVVVTDPRPSAPPQTTPLAVPWETLLRISKGNKDVRLRDVHCEVLEE